MNAIRPGEYDTRCVRHPRRCGGHGQGNTTCASCSCGWTVLVATGNVRILRVDGVFDPEPCVWTDVGWFPVRRLGNQVTRYRATRYCRVTA